ncbi:MAG: hypothetical protein NTW69_00600 [Chloroflexi bacterium]|nr:hypothetical protein [Chloroflexota bacterium]
MNTSPFLSVNKPCHESLQWTKKQLLDADLRVVQTFDLQTARIGVHDCPCPNHGTEECDCQMVVLLVYGITADPATLTLHGNNGQTWFSLTNNPNQQGNQQLITAIGQALEIRVPDFDPSNT